MGCCGEQKLRVQNEPVKWQTNNNISRNSRNIFWGSLKGDKKCQCLNKVKLWIKDNNMAIAYCQSLWDEFENK